MSYAKSLLASTNTRAHRGSSQADCERSAGNLRLLGQGQRCPVIWDGWLCWPETLAGATIKQPCPAIFKFDTQQFAYRKCLTNGTWYGIAGVTSAGSSGWSNYSLCVFPSTATTSAILPVARDLLVEQQYEQDTLQSLQTSSVAFPSDVTNTSVILPVDDIIGSALHGFSAICLLLAVVTWVTLKLTDRLVTRRHLVLMATIITAFLFHIIVLTSRLRAVALALSNQSAVSLSASLSSQSPDFTTGASPRAQGPIPLERLQRAAEDLPSVSHSVKYSHSHATDSSDRFRKWAGKTRSRRETDWEEENRGETDWDENSDMNEQSENKVGTRDVGSLVTLCQVGRAFYLLCDMAVYAFLLAVSVYYTLVVLGKELTFKRLVSMFLLGIGLPIVFVTLTILLYTFMPTNARFASSCFVDSLTDEFHWAITAPKMLCIVLSMCLMTVSTYGFWRLHVPALYASSETFYARQGVLKTLTLLLSLSFAELFWLVSEYQKLYGWVNSLHVVHACTAVLGSKGCMLAFLFCFVDNEVLHGTCCPHSSNGGEPWLRGADTIASRREGRGRGEDGKDDNGIGEVMRWRSPGAVADHDIIGSVDMGEKV